MVWDARAAIDEARAAAGARRHVLFAELALRLARLGFVADLRFTLADGTPAEALRSALAEVTAPEAEARLSAYEPAGDEPPEVGSATLAEGAHASGKRQSVQQAERPPQRTQ